MNTTLLNIHHGLMAASALLGAITRISTALALLWLTWQMVFCSGLQWRRPWQALYSGKPEVQRFNYRESIIGKQQEEQ
jgi:hypothetical protein